MVMASSTPVRELRSCLETHGIAGFFKDVVSTEDVGGRDKEFPDVYEEALRRLGTPKESTWVFEDAPFGVQTSHRAGFNVVGLMNDHDGRREEDVRPYCDVYAHGYAELSLALLNDYARPADASAPGSSAGEKPLQVLVVDGSPEPSSPELVAALPPRRTTWSAPMAGPPRAAPPALRPTFSAGTPTPQALTTPTGRATPPRPTFAFPPRSTPRTSRWRLTVPATRPRARVVRCR